MKQLVDHLPKLRALKTLAWPRLPDEIKQELRKRAPKVRVVFR